MDSAVCREFYVVQRFTDSFLRKIRRVDCIKRLADVHVTAGDKDIRYRTAEVAHVNAEGKVTERWAFSDDTQAIKDFFASIG